MATFLFGAELTKAIKTILREPNSRSAVAFWGNGSEEWVKGAGARVIANLRMGGTNPHALKRVRATKMQCDSLHAKVYIGEKGAVICSANASINGLALEGVEQSGWLEAGVQIEDIEHVSSWFEELWESGARNISPADWETAESRWNLRIKSKPPLRSFADFDPTAEQLPLVVWVAPQERWTANEEAVRSATGAFTPSVLKRVDEGLWVINEQDARSVQNRWAFIWRKLKSGKPASKPAPWFTLMSDLFVEGAFNWDGDGTPQDVILSAESPPTAPFDTSDIGFLAAFRSTIVERRFASLLEGDHEAEPWYEPREPLMRDFWTAVHAAYVETRTCK